VQPSDSRPGLDRGASEILFRDLFDQAGIGMVVTDLRGRILRCNKAFGRIVGHAEEEVPALDPLTLVHPDDRVRIGEIVRDFAAGARDRLRIERRFIRKDGAIRWGRATVSVVCDSEGQPECALAILEDVTEQHEADNELRHAEEICAAITGSSPDYIMILDLDGRIRFINRTVPGMTVDAVVGTMVFDYVPERFWPAMRACYEEVIRTGREGRYEVEYPAETGKRHTFVSRILPIRRDEQVVALTLCATDVTAQRLLEDQLRHAQKLESIGRLAGGVAHDLNNQLSIILGSTELARKGLDGGEPIKDELARIASAGERAAALTQQLLAFGRKHVRHSRILGLNTLVASVRDMVGRILGEDIRLRLRLGRVGQVRVDPVQLEQVVLNLVINACDAMPEGGDLVISTEETVLAEGHGILPGGRYALLSVTDTGTGMSRETLSRAFEPFFTTKEVGKGTGLGLAVARGIVTQSSGHIEAESEPGKGTTFRIYLPVVEGACEETVCTGPAAARGTETILLVEDEWHVLDVTRGLLEASGYRVVTARNGEEALARLADTPAVRLLLADVVMPGMDGQELACRALRARPDLRVIFLTGHDVTPRPELQSHSFLRKPVPSALLAHKLRQCLDAPAVARG